MAKILIVEDEKQIAQGVKRYLENEGYQVFMAHDGITGLDMAFEINPDLMILDLMLPGKNGYDVCKEVQREMDIPIIMLTARADEMDMVLGLEMGADDYITKPFSPRELVARVHATLRRMDKSKSKGNINQEVQFGEFTYISNNHMLLNKDGEEIPLTPIENAILEYFILNKNLALSRNQILDGAGLGAFEGVQRTIDVHVYNLRQKIEKNPTEPEFIKTVYGVGYRFTI
jgi:two-component system OmpR family response regulator